MAYKSALSSLGGCGDTAGQMDGRRALIEHKAHLRRRNLRQSTIDQRGYALGRLQRFLGPRRSLLRVTTAELRAYIDTLPSPGGAATEISHLHGFYRWAARERIIVRDPSLELERPRLKKRLPRPIPDADLRRALLRAPHHRIRPWLFLAAYAGLRAFDVAGLEADNLFLDAVPAMLLLVTKGGKMRSVPIAPLLGDVLSDSNLPLSGWLFPRLDGQTGHVPPHLVSQQANRYLHDLEIPSTFHSLRHWFGTKTYQATKDLRLTQELMGHESSRSTEGYTWIDPGAHVQAVAALPRLVA